MPFAPLRVPMGGFENDDIGATGAGIWMSFQGGGGGCWLRDNNRPKDAGRAKRISTRLHHSVLANWQIQKIGDVYKKSGAIHTSGRGLKNSIQLFL